MTRGFIAATWIALIGFAAGISFFVYTITSSSRLNTCIACKRSVQAETRTVAQVGGLKTILCCPACARMLRERGRDARIKTVTDLESGDQVESLLERRIRVGGTLRRELGFAFLDEGFGFLDVTAGGSVGKTRAPANCDQSQWSCETMK